MKEQIEQRTAGRLHGLHVRQVGRKVVLSGRASSYYVLQLALAAAQEFSAGMTLEIDVDVCVSEASSTSDSSEPPDKDARRVA
jgi:hypothetical protein